MIRLIFKPQKPIFSPYQPWIVIPILKLFHLNLLFSCFESEKIRFLYLYATSVNFLLYSIFQNHFVTLLLIEALIRLLNLNTLTFFRWRIGREPLKLFSYFNEIVCLYRVYLLNLNIGVWTKLSCFDLITVDLSSVIQRKAILTFKVFHFIKLFHPFTKLRVVSFEIYTVDNILDLAMVLRILILHIFKSETIINKNGLSV